MTRRAWICGLFLLQATAARAEAEGPPPADAQAATGSEVAPGSPSAAPASPSPTPQPSAAASVTDEASAADVQAPFGFELNSVYQGEIILLLRGGKVFVKSSDLASAGVQVPKGESLEVGGQTYLALASVSPPLKYELDEEDIKLRVTVPASWLPQTKIDLAEHPPEIIFQTRPSAFVNYAPRINQDGQLDLYEETAASFDGHLLSSTTYFSSARDPIRGLSRLELHDTDGLVRTTIGDAVVTTGPLGGGGVLGGITVARAFDLDPYLVKVPTAGYAGSTLTPATIDVYVNGARVRSEQVQPGTFHLDNLRVGGGAGLTRYVIRDVYGNEQTIDMPYYVSDGVLRHGLHEYTYSVGVVRRAMGQLSWDYGPAALLAHHRVGLSDRVTFGARAEAKTSTLSGGPTFSVLTPAGQLDLTAASSYEADAGVGAAGLAAFAYVSRAFGAGVQTQVQSHRYATTDVSAEADRATVDVVAFGSLPIGGRLTASLQTGLAKFRDRGLQLRADSQLAWRLATSTQALLTGGAGRDADGSVPWQLVLTLSTVFDGGHSAAANARVQNGQPALTIDATKALPPGEGAGYRVSGVLGETRTAMAGVQYQTLSGRYGAQYEYIGAHHVALDAAGAIAIVPGVGVFPTLPIQGSYGVIRVPNVEGVHAQVNNQEFGTTDRNGNVLVPFLLSYYGNRLSIAQEDVPRQYTLSNTDTVIAPPYRGVAVAEFALRTPHYYRGTMRVLEHGKLVVPKFGQLRVSGERAGEEIVSPLGELGEFELDSVQPGARTLSVDYVGGTCVLQRQIPESDQTVIQLGALTCTKP